MIVLCGKKNLDDDMQLAYFFIFSSYCLYKKYFSLNLVLVVNSENILSSVLV